MNSGVKRDIETPPRGAQPNKCWGCGWEVSGTASLTVSVITASSGCLCPLLAWAAAGVASEHSGGQSQGGELPVTSFHAALQTRGFGFPFVLACLCQMTFRCVRV